MAETLETLAERLAWKEVTSTVRSLFSKEIP